MSSRRAYAACGLVAALGLAGCTGGGDDPPTTKTLSTSTTTSAAPSASTTTTTSSPADAYPAAARAHTVEGGKAFVEYYYATLNKILQAPKAGVLPDLADASCEFCLKNEQRVSAMAGGGGRYDSSVISLSNLKALSGAPKGREFYSAASNQLGAWILDSSGKRFQQDRKISLPVTIVVTWEDGRWKLHGAEKA